MTMAARQKNKRESSVTPLEAGIHNASTANALDLVVTTKRPQKGEFTDIQIPDPAPYNQFCDLRPKKAGPSYEIGRSANFKKCTLVRPSPRMQRQVAGRRG